MEDTVTFVGELLVSIVAALFVIGTVVLLLSPTDAGVLRSYLASLLEAAC